MVDGPLPPLSHEESESLYGPWVGTSPVETMAELAGADFPWWVSGGWALDAATGTSRPHGDTDVVVLRDDLPALRERLAGYHLWEPLDGALRPLRPGDDLTEGCEQLWVRRDAGSPWVWDVLLTETDGGDWLCKRDRSIRLPLDAIGWIHDGVPYLRPEIVLLFKAKHLRAKDLDDFERTLPHLDPAARSWLAEGLRVVHPGHPWLASLGA